jgi:DNA-directed RNA polymerase subunit RPC12/RpoP
MDELEAAADIYDRICWDNEISDEDAIKCPACGIPQRRDEAALGALGNLTWFRCRYCGMTFNEDGEIEHD